MAGISVVNFAKKESIGDSCIDFIWNASNADVLVTLPDGSKGWTDGLGNGYIR